MPVFSYIQSGSNPSYQAKLWLWSASELSLGKEWTSGAVSWDRLGSGHFGGGALFCLFQSTSGPQRFTSSPNAEDRQGLSVMSSVQKSRFS